MERFRYDGTQAGRKEVFGPKGRDIFYVFSQISLADITTIVYTYRNLFGTDNS